jgi:hypothetical protein
VRLGAAAVAEARSGAVRDKALAAVVEEGGCGCVRCCSDVRSAFFWFAHKMRAVMANAVVGRLYHAWNRWFFGALRVLAAAMKFQHGRVVAQSGGGALFDGAISAEYWSSICAAFSLFQAVSRVVSFFRSAQTYHLCHHFVQGDRCVQHKARLGRFW